MAIQPRKTEPYEELPAENLKKGVHYHEFEGKKYDVDTFYDELCWEEVIIDREGHPLHRVWKYYQDTVACFSCQKTADMQYCIQRMGVYGKCQWCKITFPVVPFDPESKENIAELVKSEAVSPSKAIEICARIGQKIPDQIALQRPRQRRHKEAE